MSKKTKLRLFGGIILLFNLMLIGYYNINGITVLILTFGFAIGYELFVIRNITEDTPKNTRIFDNEPPSKTAKTSPHIENYFTINSNSFNEDLPSKTKIIYSKIAEELKNNKSEGVWLQALVESNGNEKNAAIIYAKIRIHEIETIENNKKQTARNNKIKAEKKIYANEELVAAISNGNYSAAKKLLENGVKPIGINQHGQFLIEIAESKNDKLLVNLIKNYREKFEI